MSKPGLIRDIRELQHSGAYKLIAQLITMEEKALLSRLRYADTAEEVRKLQGALGALESIKDAMQIP